MSVSPSASWVFMPRTAYFGAFCYSLRGCASRCWVVVPEVALNTWGPVCPRRTAFNRG